MPSVTLDNLPLEVLQEVASLVYDFKDYSLSSLNSVNRKCSDAASKFCFRDIDINVVTPPGAYWHPEYDAAIHETEARKWLEILHLRDALKHVRRLHIQKYQDTVEYPHERKLVKTLLGRPGLTGLSRAVVRRELNRRYVSGYQHILRNDRYSAQFAESFQFHFEDEENEQTVDRDWSQTCKLVASLSRLTDLTTDLDYVEFPKPLLETLHRDQPQCRLNLRWPVFGSTFMNPRQLANAAFPCLHKITCTVEPFTGSHHHRRSANELLHMITQLAPNIKQIDCDQPLRPRPGDFEVAKPSKSAQLESLILRGVPSDLKYLQFWQFATNFSLLRHMNFAMGLKLDALLFVASKPQESPLFPCLESLEILVKFNTIPNTSHHFSERRDEMIAIAGFFTNLAPLESLKLTGEMDRVILLSAVRRHGCKLRELIILPYLCENLNSRYNSCIRLCKDDIHQVHELAPLLQTLTLPIPRTKSDGPELDIYQTLSQFKGICNLHILLDCSMPWVINHQDQNLATDGDGNQPWFEPTRDPAFSEFDNELCDPENAWGPGCPRRGHIRDNFLNAAVDEKLALSIWDVLKSGPLGNTLNHLTLLTTGIFHFGPGMIRQNWAQKWPNCNYYLREYYEDMGSCFEIEACWTEGSSVSRSIREVGRERRLAAIEALASHVNLRPSARESRADSISDSSDKFHRIWRRDTTCTSKTWLDEVESLPLQADTISNISRWLRETKLGYLRYDDPFY